MRWTRAINVMGGWGGSGRCPTSRGSLKALTCSHGLPARDPGAVLVDRQHVVQDLRADPVRHQHLRAQAVHLGELHRPLDRDALSDLAAQQPRHRARGDRHHHRDREPRRLRGGPAALPRPRVRGEPDPDPLPDPARAAVHPALPRARRAGRHQQPLGALPLLPDLHRALLHLAAHRLLQGPARRAGRSRPDRRGRPRHRVRARAPAAGRPRPRRLGHLRVHPLLERVPLRPRLHPGRDRHHGARWASTCSSTATSSTGASSWPPP